MPHYTVKNVKIPAIVYDDKGSIIEHVIDVDTDNGCANLTLIPLKLDSGDNVVTKKIYGDFYVIDADGVKNPAVY